MRYYIVEHTNGDWDNLFICKANNAKEAINIVFNEHFEWENTQELKDRGYKYFYKNELVARRLDKEFGDNEKYVYLH